MKDNFQETDLLKSICKGLQIWNKISYFLNISTIDNVDVYQSELQFFKQDIVKFYEVGAKTFLSKDNNNIGNDETFYMHCLRFYLPVHAKLYLKNIKWDWEFLICKDLKEETKSLKIH